MSHLEPTYLRYIYDSLLKGSIHPENAAELPDGLIGLYEEAFDERTSVIDRQKLLQRFAIWALLKKEVSAAFVAEILGETEDDIQEFISSFSAWFNSPESGKYQLYHERLKVYLLQKLSEGELQMLHEKLIKRLEQAIVEQKVDEFEWYGLEFLAGHLSVAAMLNGDGKKLIDLAYSQINWQRQLKMSKGYTWTKRSLNEVMNWASKYNDDEVIECGLQMVDLFHQEQNAAPQIVALVAQGNFDAALKRIEQFGGNDEEGLKRKFILYMLCLMELTLLDSKEKIFRKVGIEKVLKHLDAQLPVDHTILKWIDFFPSDILFLMAFECASLNLDTDVLFKRTNDWENDALNELGIQNNHQYQVVKSAFNFLSSQKVKRKIAELIIKELLQRDLFEEAIEFAYELDDENEKCKSIYLIVKDLLRIGRFEKAIEYTKEITNPQEKCSALIEIASQKAKQVSHELKSDLLNEALECCRSIRSDINKSEMLARISSEFFMLSITDKAEIVLHEALENISKINNEFGDQSIAMKAILIEMAKQGRLDSALEYARKLDNTYEDKSLTLYSIFAELTNQGSTKEASYILKEAKDCARMISSNDWKITALVGIACELFKLGLSKEFTSLIQESLQVIKSNPSYKFNDLALLEIPIKLATLGEFKAAIEFHKNLPESISKKSLLKDLAVEFSRQGEIKGALKLAREIKDVEKKCQTLLVISTHLNSNANFDAADLILNEAINIAQQLPDERLKNIVFHEIRCHLGKQKKSYQFAQLIQESLGYSKGITEVDQRRNIIVEIAINLATQGRILEAVDYARNCSTLSEKASALRRIYSKMDATNEAEEVILESLECARCITEVDEKCRVLLHISKTLYNHGKIEDALIILNETYHLVLQMKDDFTKGNLLTSITADFAKYGKFEEAQEIASLNENILSRLHALGNIATEMVRKGRIVEAERLMKMILDDAHQVNSNHRRISILLNIVVQFIKQGQIEKAEVLLKEIIAHQGKRDSELLHREMLVPVIVEFSKMGELERAMELIQKITDISSKGRALMNIAIEQVKQGNWTLAEEIGLQIQQTNQRYWCWERIGKEKLDTSNSLDRIKQVDVLQNIETQKSYLKGIIRTLDISQCNKDFLLYARRYFMYDIKSLEKLFQLYGLNALFFLNTNPKWINRLNQSLNLQWALDIKNQLRN